MTEDAGMLALAFAAGAGLGLLYFGTLWIVVRRLPRMASPGLWLGATAVLRLIAVLALLLAVSGGLWPRLVAALAGFVAARVACTRRAARPRVAPGPETPRA